ncbi:hypothetical protein GCM10020001_118930 [Nonomuraea salmonea]
MTVAAPAVQPYGFGLFSVAQWPVEADPHWRCGVQWEPYACGPARLYPIDQCAEGEPPEKQVEEGTPLVEATPLVVYGGYHCKLPGRTVPADIEDRARQSLALGEQRAVEEAVWTGAAGNSPWLASPDATVLNAAETPGAGDALKAIGAIAALEAYLGATYGGLGVIHVPRGAVPALAFYQQIVRDGSVLRTVLGTPVAAYGGSPNTGPAGEPAPAGTAWAYATGPVAIRRGEVLVTPTPVPAAGFDRKTNQVHLLAEREYVVGWDCLLGAALMDISC